MLALARKVNESIMLGNDIEITLLEIKGDRHQCTKICSDLPQGDISADPGGE